MEKSRAKQEFITRVLNEMQEQIKCIFAKPYNGANIDMHDICEAIPYLYKIASTGKAVCNNYEVYRTLSEYESFNDNFAFAYDLGDTDEAVITIEEN